MPHNRLIALLSITAVVLITIYITISAGGAWDYVLPKRTEKIIAIVVTGAAIALSTVIFQTITNNRILTPSVIGLDSLYLLIQTLVVYFFGSTTLFFQDKNVQFIVNVGIMVAFASLLYRVLFRREDRSIYFILLVGIICGTLFRSIASFIQMLIDPNEFLIVQDRMFASFQNIHTNLLAISIVSVLIVFIYFLRFFRYLDVIALGRDHAVNLGVHYDFVVKRLFLIISVLVSVATALVGPITFLGLLVVNMTYQMFKTFRHRPLIFGSILIAVITLVGGQLLVERVFTFNTTVSVVINFIGGVYFIFLLLREGQSW